MTHKESEKTMWDHNHHHHHRHHPMRTQSGVVVSAVSQTKAALFPKQLMVWLIFFVSTTYVVYTLKLLAYSNGGSCGGGQDNNNNNGFFTPHNKITLLFNPNHTGGATIRWSQLYRSDPHVKETEKLKINPHANRGTGLEHIVFGIAASANLWDQRKNYIKLWWKREKKMRGIVWLDSPVNTSRNETKSLPELRISSDTSRFPYKNRDGHRSAIRISRIVSETFNLGMKNVRWFVMGDDDTVFVTENLVRVLNKYDHNQLYYIGSLSESHLQNIYFSYSMAYGGGGFAISYPLAKALVQMQDRCIQRYPSLYGSDDRMQACMAELGVPLTKELGFHQYDVYGNLFGLLAAHPVTPLVTLHHLDVVEPIFPNATRVEALQRLMIPMKLDSAGLIQQSICYDKSKSWTVSVSWGFAIQVFRGILSPREVEMPSRTFLNWYRRADYKAYAFNTRPVARNLCQKPYVFFMSKARMNRSKNKTVSEYTRLEVPYPMCRWRMESPAEIDIIEVYKKPDPHLWDRSPRRNCCRVLESKERRMVVDVGLCRVGEVSEV